MIGSIVLYFYFFVQICLFLFLSMILYSIFLKSYKPKNSLVIIVILLVVFIFNGLLATAAVSNLSNTIDRQVKDSTVQPTF
ncbi:MAG: hypothetical protein H7230_01915 [Candidatus Parcubacteria bacterium]|nr:hypothetical protein [Candidatus Paceibacterota bacterium]